MKVSLKNKLSEIHRLSEMVEAYAEQEKLSARFVHTLTLVLDELITNVISYGYDDENEHTINVEVTRNSKAVTVMISDDAKPYNPFDRPAPDVDLPIEERDIGGLGVHFVKELMDEFHYRFEDGCNIVTLLKKL